MLSYWLQLVALILIVIVSLNTVANFSHGSTTRSGLEMAKSMQTPAYRGPMVCVISKGHFLFLRYLQ